MNQEYLQQDEMDIEVKDKLEVVSVEQKKDSQEFAEETLGRIEQDFKSVPDSKEEIERMENSILLENQSTKSEIKNELDLDNRLVALDNEAENLKNNTKSKISEISGFSKAYHHPEYRKDVAKQILEARKSGKDAEEIRTKFYEKTGSEKENFESQEKERSVAEIMKEKNLVVVHAIPLHTQGQGSGRGSIENNRAFKNEMQRKINFEDSVEMITGLSPTISTSIPSPDRHNNGLFNKTGVILGGGKILAAHAGDSGSVAHGLYKRIPKEALEGENRIHYSAIHNVDVDKITPASKEVVRGESHNELTIENPEIAGLFIDMTIQTLEANDSIEKLKPRYGYDGVTYSDDGIQITHWLSEERIREKAKEARELEIKNQENDLLKMKEYSEKMNVPVYAFKKEEGKLNKYRIDFSETDKKSEYFNNVLIPEYDELLDKFGKNSVELNKFISEKFLPFRKEFPMKPDSNGNYVSEKALYTLTPVNAKEIYESKREIKPDERQKMIEDIKSKGILSEVAEKEVDKKFQN